MRRGDLDIKILTSNITTTFLGPCHGCGFGEETSKHQHPLHQKPNKFLPTYLENRSVIFKITQDQQFAFSDRPLMQQENRQNHTWIVYAGISESMRIWVLLSLLHNPTAYCILQVYKLSDKKGRTLAMFISCPLVSCHLSKTPGMRSQDQLLCNLMLLISQQKARLDDYLFILVRAQ